MTSAYVLIEAASGRISAILAALRQIPEVAACDAVTGQFDVIARIEAEDINALGRVSYAKIQMIDGVLRTITCNVIRLDG
jgi:DNA-binding Lrp family transcriptional regulator